MIGFSCSHFLPPQDKSGLEICSWPLSFHRRPLPGLPSNRHSDQLPHLLHLRGVSQGLGPGPRQSTSAQHGTVCMFTLYWVLLSRPHLGFSRRKYTENMARCLTGILSEAEAAVTLSSRSPSDSSSQSDLCDLSSQSC